MARAEGRVTINRPAEMVFDFVLDGGNNVLWHPWVTDVAPLGEKPYGVGSAFMQGMRGPGGRIDGNYRIIECKPNRLIKYVATTGPLKSTGTYRFKADGTSTAVTFVLNFQTSWIDRVRGRAMDVSMKSEISALSYLKTYLEEHPLTTG